MSSRTTILAVACTAVIVAARGKAVAGACGDLPRRGSVPREVEESLTPASPALLGPGGQTAGVPASSGNAPSPSRAMLSAIPDSGAVSMAPIPGGLAVLVDATLS